MTQALQVPDPQPMVEMNTTPLIDVMLVLLIMLIITIPIQTHAVKLDLPTCTGCPIPQAHSNEIAITRSGTILWNGTVLPESGVRYELAATQRMRPVPELHLRPDAAARYETVDRVLALIKRERVQKVGFVGNEAYANW
jgi:biopolymer transport protein ExbD